MGTQWEYVTFSFLFNLPDVKGEGSILANIHLKEFRFLLPSLYISCFPARKVVMGESQFYAKTRFSPRCYLKLFLFLCLELDEAYTIKKQLLNSSNL